ncbi:MAG: type II toxin-antitoxin system RelE/ParE family toxin [Phycisphaerales bacterium]
MTTPVWIDLRALAEADATARWYEARRPGHGAQFRLEIDHVLSRVAEHPEGYQPLSGTLRRAFTRRFPFVVVYRIAGGQVQVIGVVPTQADPTVVSLLMDARAS